MAGRGGATAEQHVGIRGQPCHSTHTPPPAHDGQFLLQMLRQNHPQNPTTSTPTHPPPPTPTSSSATVSASLSVYNQLVDPAIAALGPSLPFTPHPNSPPYDKPLLPALSETRFPSSPWTNALVPENNHFAPLNLPGFSEVPWPRRIDGFDHGNSHFKASVMPVPGNLSASGPDFGRKQQHGVCNPTQPGILGNFQGFVGNRNKFDDGNTRELKMEESNSQSWPLTFGSIPCELRNLERLSCGNSSGSLNPVEEKALKGEISLKSHVQGAVRILSKRATDQEAMVTGSSIDSPLCSTDCGIDLSTRESFYNRENRGVHVHQQHGRGDPRGRFNKMDSNVKQTVAFQRSSIQDGAHVSHKERSRPPGFLQRFGTGKGAEQRVPKNERQEGERSMYGDEDGSNNWNRSPLYAEGGNVHNRIGEEEMLMEKLLGNRRNQSGDCGSIPAIPNPKSWSEMGESWSRRVSVDNELVDRHSRQGGDVPSRLLLTAQFDHPGPPRESNLHSVPASDIEQSLTSIHGKDAGEKCRPGVHNSERTNRASSSRGSINGKVGAQEQDMFAEEIMGSLIRREEFANKNARGHYYSSSGKGPQPPGQRMSSRRREMECRSDLERHTSYFISIYETLIPAAEEKAKQKQLLESLEKLISKEWPGAQLYLYGSCANSFGVSNSDIDVCLEINESDMSKSDILLKLADILLSDNLQNVQALTRARVPIVKLMDPMTGISCDICINNALAVVNTKLLRDYSEIDVRLRQLAFIVKHWAKSRRVNETYQGTLSSYAYVLMCIHFLQMRKPAILPCLQEMKATYVVTVDEIECAYFDQVEKLHDFGAQNKETISQLLWAFFDYWAYRHDYANSVISVRTGSFISKREKDWTRRIGNDRHLICIEDPFETSHDLGRVVDKYSIKILREEFERAANILNYDPNPSVTLFEPYVPG